MWKPTIYGGYLDEMPFSTLQSAVPDYQPGTSLEHPRLQFKRNHLFRVLQDILALSHLGKQTILFLNFNVN